MPISDLYLPSPTQPSAAQLSVHRKRLLLELFETEQRYVFLITVLIRHFLRPLLLLTTTDTDQFLSEEEVHAYGANSEKKPDCPSCIGPFHLPERQPFAFLQHDLLEHSQPTRTMLV